MKVLVLGLPRTGTQSLADALEKLGISPIYHMREVGKNNHAGLWTDLLITKFDPNNHNSSSPPSRDDFDVILSQYDGLADYPAAIFATELLNAYPEAAVILTVRSEDAWQKSMKQTIIHNFARRSPNDSSPMAVLGRTYSKACWDDDFDRNGIQLFRRHNEQVRRAVKGRKFLEYTLGDGWEPLCVFFGLAVPENVPFPRSDDWIAYKKAQEKGIDL